MKKFLLVFAALLVLLVGAALVAPSFIDWTRYRDPIAAEIERAAGRKVVIAGTVEASLLPTPRLLLNDARLGNLPGASTPEMARLKSLEARIALLPLLSGRVVVESFVMREPVVTLEVLADGRRNWVFDADAPALSIGDEPLVAPESVQLQNASIVNGTVIYRDARSGSEERFEAVNARVVADSLAGPLRAAGEGRIGDKPVRFTVAAGRFDARSSAATPLNATFDLMAPTGGTLRAGFAFNGTAQFAPKLQLTGKAKLGGADFVAALSSFGPLDDMPGFLTQPFNVEGTLTASDERAEIANLMVQLGDVQSQGGAHAVFVGPADGKPQFDLALTFGYIDLDAWLDMPDRAGDAKDGDGFVLPSGFRLSVDASAEAVNFRKGLFRQLKLSGALADGAVTLRQFSAQAPGGTDATLNGRFTAEANVPPRFDGRIDLASDDFRSLLGWTGIDAKALPAGRLNKLTATGRLGLGFDTLELSDLDLRFDSTKVTGGIVAALRARPAFGANLVVNQFNLDSYIPSDDSLALPPDVIAAFDANLLVNAGQFTWRQVPMRGLALDATLDSGNLTLRKLAAGIDTGDGNGGFSVAGDVKDIAGKPAVALDVEAHAKDPAGLYRLSGVTPPVTTTGALKLATRIESDAKGYRLPKIDAALGDMTLAGDAALALDGAKPKLTGKLAVSEIDTAGLLSVATPPASPSSGPVPWSEAPLALYLLALGDADLDFSAKTLTHKSWHVANAAAHVAVTDGALSIDKLTGSLLGGAFTLDAKLTPAEGGAALEGKMALSGADAKRGLFDSKVFDAVDGKLDLAMDFATKGAHEAGFIAALGGKGQFALHDAALRGVDLAAANKKLPTVEKVADLQALLKAATAGSSKLSALDGSFTVENGTLSSDDMTLTVDGATGDGGIRANLPAWTIGGEVAFKFAADAAAPPVHLQLSGPMAAPNKSFESEALQAYVLERAAKAEAEREAKRAAARAAQQPAQVPATRAPAARPQAAPAQPVPVQTVPVQTAPPQPAPIQAAPTQPAQPNGDAFINDVLKDLPTQR
ncbi:MAG TPA: AsmA family protein [Alphaproteobacteria bacterium]